MSAQLQLRVMEQSDVKPVLKIISAHDEDDADWARQTYRSLGTHGHYVLVEDRHVLGVTGTSQASGTDGSYWLSWTYLASDRRGVGAGRFMLDQVTDRLKEAGARKLFVSTSDYIDPKIGPIYADAVACYESAGFRLEVRHPDYYDIGEAQCIYGLRLKPPGSGQPTASEIGGVRLTGCEEIGETEGAYLVEWESTEDGNLFTPEDVAKLALGARDKGARCLFISFPSDIPQITSLLASRGWFEEGRLFDFFEDGIHDIRYRLNMPKNI